VLSPDFLSTPLCFSQLCDFCALFQHIEHYIIVHVQCCTDFAVVVNLKRQSGEK